MLNNSDVPDIELHSERLILKTISEEDAGELYPLINDADITKNLIRVPYPYPRDILLPWIKSVRESMRYGELYEMSIYLKSTGKLIGICSLRIDSDNKKGEVGYWLGKLFWNNGYMTEAVKRLIEYGFDDLDLHRVSARCFSSNAASARVLSKCGLKFEGCAKGEICKNGEYIDILHFGIVISDY